MKKLLFRGGMIGGTLALIIAGAAAFSAFEAHVVNVTATINNALDVPVEAQGLSFGTVFPQEKLDQNFNVSLSSSFNAQTQCSAINFVTNGGFETPAVTNGAGWDIFSPAQSGWQTEWAIPGGVTTWNGNTRPTQAVLEYQKGAVLGWLPHGGSQYAEIDSDWFGPSNPISAPSLVNIYQNVATTIGKQYTLSFWYSARPGTDLNHNQLDVYVGGVNVGHASADGTGKTQTDWHQYTFPFTATGASTEIRFDGLGTNDALGSFLDDVSLTANCAGQTTVDYVIKQKPKCVDANGAHPQVTENPDGTFLCPGTSTMMPLLCPYLSKHVVSGGGNDGTGINAFHGLPGPWTLATTNAAAVNTTGVLSAPGDLTDTWNIDLKAPCFVGQCAQDWPAFVLAENSSADPVAYEALPGDESKVFGCDLWLEVTGIPAP